MDYLSNKSNHQIIKNLSSIGVEVHPLGMVEHPQYIKFGSIHKSQHIIPATRTLVLNGRIR